MFIFPNKNQPFWGSKVRSPGPPTLAVARVVSKRSSGAEMAEIYREMMGKSEDVHGIFMMIMDDCRYTK